MKLIDIKFLNEKAQIMTDENENKCYAIPISDITTMPIVNITLNNDIVKKMYDTIHIIVSEYEEDMANEVIGTILSSFMQMQKPIIDVFKLGDWIEFYSETERNKAIIDLFNNGYVATPRIHYNNDGTKSNHYWLNIVGKLFEAEKQSFF